MTLARPARTASRLTAAGLSVSLLLAPGPAPAQFGQASPHTLDLNQAFSFNGDAALYAKPPDCKPWSEAVQAFRVLDDAGKAFAVIKGKEKAASFVQHAYAERLRPIQYVDLESVIIETVGEDRFRIYTGSKPKGVVCGFDRPQFLDKVWFEAGVQGKPVPVAQRPASPLDPLRVAYWLESYALVRNSLQQRGYSLFQVPQPVGERCKPLTERLCETYPEALCDNDVMAGISCTFVFKRNGTNQVIGVDTRVQDLTQYTARIEVTGLRELGTDP